MKLGGSEGFLLLFDGMATRDRRAILLGLGIVGLALTWMFGVRPYRAALAEVSDWVVAERGLLAREQALLASGDDFAEALRQAQVEAQRVEGRMLNAPSIVLAEGELTDFLEMAAFQSRVLLEEIRGGELARGEEPPPGLSVVRLHLSGESDLEGVLTFLDEIEKSQLLLRVRGMALEPEVSRPDGDEEGGGNRDPVPTGVVQFQLILDGFARPEGGPESQADRLTGRNE